MTDLIALFSRLPFGSFPAKELYEAVVIVQSPPHFRDAFTWKFNYLSSRLSML